MCFDIHVKYGMYFPQIKISPIRSSFQNKIFFPISDLFFNSSLPLRMNFSSFMNENIFDIISKC